MKKKAAGRPRKELDEVLVDLPIKVAPDTLSEVEGIAVQLDRPRGWVARKLLLRGIEAYYRDLKIKRPEDAIQTEQEAARKITGINELLSKPDRLSSLHNTQNLDGDEEPTIPINSPDDRYEATLYEESDPPTTKGGKK